MADVYYPIPENPAYNSQIRALQNDDPANAEEIFNPLFERLIENTEAVKIDLQVLSEKAYCGNIDVQETDDGVTIMLTDENGVKKEVHINTLALVSINSWSDIRNAVRLGLGPKLFPVGYEFITLSPANNYLSNITWIVRGHDHHMPTNKKLTHSMTIEAKNCLSGPSNALRPLKFNSKEALYYVSEELEPGQYWFYWAYAVDKLKGGNFYFEITKSIPSGGKIVIDSFSSSSTMTSYKIKTYDNSNLTIESNILIRSGSIGTGLGTIFENSSNSENLNCGNRMLNGSNNYASSYVRRFLNGYIDIQGKFNIPDIFNYTFIDCLPEDFLSVVQSTEIPCQTNSVFETDSVDGGTFKTNQAYVLNDKFFLLSYPEISGIYDTETLKEGKLLEYYENLTGTELIKYDTGGQARAIWTRSCDLNSASAVKIINTDGTWSVSESRNSGYICPACIIA